MKLAEKKAPRMRTFGTSSLSWNEIPLTSGTRSSETQFLHLMQLLLHFRTEGVSRALLVDTLFSDREVRSVSHSLNVLLYNARRRLEAAGLPEGPYIEQREGRFYWASEVPVEEDAATLMLCALVDPDGELLKKSAKNDALVGRFEEALLGTLRRAGVVCRYGTYQYLALLPDTKGERIASLCRRIDEHFDESAGTTRTKYYVNQSRDDT